MRRLNVQTHPQLATVSRPRATLTWTKHARERVRTKGVRFDESVLIEAGHVVEMELAFNGSLVTKLVVRQPQSPDWDRVLVLVPNGEGWTVVTCWLNHRKDTHKTLNKSRISA